MGKAPWITGVLFVVVFFGLLVSFGCGKKAPPEPPDQKTRSNVVF